MVPPPARHAQHPQGHGAHPTLQTLLACPVPQASPVSVGSTHRRHAAWARTAVLGRPRAVPAEPGPASIAQSSAALQRAWHVLRAAPALAAPHLPLDALQEGTPVVVPQLARRAQHPQGHGVKATPQTLLACPAPLESTVPEAATHRRHVVWTRTAVLGRPRAVPAEPGSASTAQPRAQMQRAWHVLREAPALAAPRLPLDVQ
jgi:hypothetical protein